MSKIGQEVIEAMENNPEDFDNKDYADYDLLGLGDE